MNKTLAVAIPVVSVLLLARWGYSKHVDAVKKETAAKEAAAIKPKPITVAVATTGAATVSSTTEALGRLNRPYGTTLSQCCRSHRLPGSA